jgi:hypothetical protein
MKKAFAQKTPLFTCDIKDELKDATGKQFLQSMLDKKGQVVTWETKNKPDGGLRRAFVVWPNSFLIFMQGRYNSSRLVICSLDKPFLEELFCEIDKLTYLSSGKDKESNEVFVLTKYEDATVNLEEAGEIKATLVEGNYGSEEIEQATKIVYGLGENNLHGRLIVIEGPPGTGKTYLVKGIVSAVKGAIFILVSPSNLRHVFAPDFIPRLNRIRENYLEQHELKEAPTVIIVEDADELLVHRMADNMASVASLLNLTDGILGSLMDLYVIATTNSQGIEIDEALKRPGRMAAHIKTGNLSQEHAASIYRRLVDNESVNYLGKPDLASIYAQAASAKGRL